MKTSSKSAFTLVEMIVTISILALLAGAATPMLFKLVGKAKISRAQADCDAVVKAIIMFQQETSAYPGGAQNDPTYNYQNAGGLGFAPLFADLTQGTDRYLSEEIGLDPWGNEYLYHIYTRVNPYVDVVVYSMGPNGTSQSWSSAQWLTGSFAGDDIGSMHDM